MSPQRDMYGRSWLCGGDGFLLSVLHPKQIWDGENPWMWPSWILSWACPTAREPPRPSTFYSDVPHPGSFFHLQSVLPNPGSLCPSKPFELLSFPTLGASVLANPGNFCPSQPWEFLSFPALGAFQEAPNSALGLFCVLWRRPSENPLAFCPLAVIYLSISTPGSQIREIWASAELD